MATVQLIREAERAAVARGILEYPASSSHEEASPKPRLRAARTPPAPIPPYTFEQLGILPAPTATSGQGPIVQVTPASSQTPAVSTQPAALAPVPPTGPTTTTPTTVQGMGQSGVPYPATITGGAIVRQSVLATIQGATVTEPPFTTAFARRDLEHLLSAYVPGQRVVTFAQWQQLGWLPQAFVTSMRRSLYLNASMTPPTSIERQPWEYRDVTRLLSPLGVDITARIRFYEKWKASGLLSTAAVQLLDDFFGRLQTDAVHRRTYLDHITTTPYVPGPGAMSTYGITSAGLPGSQISDVIPPMDATLPPPTVPALQPGQVPVALQPPGVPAVTPSVTARTTPARTTTSNANPVRRRSTRRGAIRVVQSSLLGNQCQLSYHGALAQAKRTRQVLDSQFPRCPNCQQLLANHPNAPPPNRRAADDPSDEDDDDDGQAANDQRYEVGEVQSVIDEDEAAAARRSRRGVETPISTPITPPTDSGSSDGSPFRLTTDDIAAQHEAVSYYGVNATGPTNVRVSPPSSQQRPPVVDLTMDAGS